MKLLTFGGGAERQTAPSRTAKKELEKARLVRAQQVAEQTGQRWERVKTWADSPFFSGK